MLLSEVPRVLFCGVDTAKHEHVGHTVNPTEQCSRLPRHTARTNRGLVLLLLLLLLALPPVPTVVSVSHRQGTNAIW